MSDYAAGKEDWLAAGRPYEGDADLVSRHVEGDVPSCAAGDAAGEAVRRHPGAGEVVVLGEGGVVLGVLDPASVDPDDERPAVEAAAPAPTTVRAGEATGELRRRMADADVSEVLVTTPEGHLLGRFR